MADACAVTLVQVLLIAHRHVANIRPQARAHCCLSLLLPKSVTAAYQYLHRRSSINHL